MTVMHRLIPPANGGTTIANGRSYSAAAGAQDVPDFDAVVLQANGWSFLALSGPTPARPNAAGGSAPLHVGQRHWDSTINHMVVWDGKAWRKEDGTVG